MHAINCWRPTRFHPSAVDLDNAFLANAHEAECSPGSAVESVVPQYTRALGTKGRGYALATVAGDTCIVESEGNCLRPRDGQWANEGAH